jgi:flagellin-like hook-associated protein FlgL
MTLSPDDKDDDGVDDDDLAVFPFETFLDKSGTEKSVGKNIKAEMDQLSTQITDVLANTEFNGQKLFNGTAGTTGTVKIQAGATSDDSIDLKLDTLTTNADIIAVAGATASAIDVTATAFASTDLNKFDKALAAVKTFIKENPDTPEDFKIGMTVNIALAGPMEKGDVNGANAVIDGVVKEYPQSDLAKNADKIKASIKARLEQMKANKVDEKDKAAEK